jgi:phosphatidylglycerol:prolipoprotein diacylglycerol transferase
MFLHDETISFPGLGIDGIDPPSTLPFSIFGKEIYFYGVIIAVGFLLAILYARSRCKSFGITFDSLLDAILISVPIAIVCARIYYVAFTWDKYKDNILSAFAIWEGGLAIYGGVLGGALGLLIATKRSRISTRAMFDDFACGLLIGQAVGRWGNFTNREAYGAQTTVPWRMGLVYSYKTFYYHPTFLYESLWNVLGLVIIHFWSKKHRRYDGQMFLAYLAWYGLGRIFIEGLRTDSLYVGSTNLRVSQLLAGLTCILALAVMFYMRFFRRPEPENLWLNRKGAGPAPAEGPGPEKETEAEEDQVLSAADIDEELREAFRILSGEDEEGAGEGQETPPAEPSPEETKQEPEAAEPGETAGRAECGPPEAAPEEAGPEEQE